MRWLSANWIWMVVVGGMLWMHLGMHRGHGGHEGHVDKRAPEDLSPSGRDGNRDHRASEPPTERAGGGATHRHRGC